VKEKEERYRRHAKRIRQMERKNGENNRKRKVLTEKTTRRK
jgi:hypothetical protein